MKSELTFLGVPPEIRQLIYYELLVLDHNSTNWEWDLEGIGAFSRRHGIMRVNSKIRQETQRFLYGKIPWRVEIDCLPLAQWELLDKKYCKIFNILAMLDEWHQLSCVHELTLRFTIDMELTTELYTFPDLDKICGYFPAIQRLNITWCDQNWEMEWEEKTMIILQPLVAMQSVTSFIIQGGRIHNGRKTRQELMERLEEIVAKQRRGSSAALVKLAESSR